MALDRKKLKKWILRQLVTGSDTEDPLTRLTLKHALGGNRAAVVLDEKCDPTVSADELASKFEEAANDDAAGLGGFQSYVITSHYTEFPDKIRERMSFKLSVETEDESGGSELTEGPNATGLVSQLMRHNEASARIASMGMTEVVRVQARMIERQGQMIESMTQKQMDVMELYSTMLEAQSTREIEKMKVTSEIARTDKAVEQLMVLAPAVVNRLGGKKMLPESASPGEVMVENLAKSLTPEQFSKLQGVLDPQQQLMILELIQNAQAREDAEKKKKEG